VRRCRSTRAPSGLKFTSSGWLGSGHTSATSARWAHWLLRVFRSTSAERRQRSPQNFCGLPPDPDRGQNGAPQSWHPVRA
jgi:hypothetical protein